MNYFLTNPLIRAFTSVEFNDELRPNTESTEAS